MSSLFDEFQKILKNRPTPAFIIYDHDVPTYLSAANIYYLVLKRIKQRYRQGLREGKTLMIVPDSFNAIIDFMACLKLRASYFPVAPTKLDKEEFKIIETSSLNLNLSTYSPLILNTSGTNNQKTYGMTEQGLLFQLQGHEDFLKNYPHSHKLSMLPLFHCFGFILDYLLAIKMDKYLSFMGKGSFFLKDVERAFFDEEIDFITGVPKQMELLINFAQKSPELALKLKKCIFYYGGAKLPSSINEKAKDCFKDIIHGYGLTEAGPGVLMNDLALENIDLKLKNGRLCIKSPSLAQGLDLEDGYFLSNDIFEYIDEKYILLGRDDEFIKSSNGTFSHFEEIEKVVFKRFNVDLQILKFENKIVSYQIIEENEQVNNNLYTWLEKNYPILEPPRLVSRLELYELMQKGRGKSRKDILKAM